MTNHNYDVIILGGGIGGYTAAIRGKQIGLSVALVEQDKLGGTCLHRGCIPTKSLLHTAQLFQASLNSNDFGVITKEVSLDFKQTQVKKQKTVDQLHNGLKSLFKRHEIPIYYGYGSIEGHNVVVKQADSQILLQSKKAIIIATGSRPKPLAPFVLNGRNILNTDQILELSQLPESILIIGGGVVGVEFASLLSDLGVDVTIIEQQAGVLIHEDHEIQEEITRQLQNKKVKIFTNAVIDNVKEHANQIELLINQGSDSVKLKASHCLVSIGRDPNTESLGLNHTQVQLNQGFVVVNENYQTTDSHFYAVGDVIGHPMLAHVAMHQGLHAIESIGGLRTGSIPKPPIPYCIYTNPEIGRVGLTEQQAREQGYQVKIGKFKLNGNSKAVLSNLSQGFIKVIVDEQTDDLLGAHLIGASATELVSIFGIGMLMDISGWELAHTMLPHPTVAEAIMEAVYDLQAQAIHK